VPLMRRRPLLRAAAIGGGAYDAGRRRAAARLRETGVRSSPADQLRELARLRAQGMLTEEEFAVQKSKVLEALALRAGTER
jgi:hypothetical protein